MLREPDFSCAILGVGPAGSGFLFALNRLGAISRLPGPLLLIERRSRLGEGRLGEYKVSANSIARAFLECLNEPTVSDLDLGGVQPWIRALEKQRDFAPDLATVAKVLSAMTERLVQTLEERRLVVARRDATVFEVRILRPRLFEIVWSDQSGAKHSATASSIILNLGGTQSPKDAQSVLAAAGFLQASDLAALFASDPLLRLDNGNLVHQIGPVIQDSGTAILIGASHSGFSLADRLTESFDGKNLRNIIIVARTPVRLYYESVGAALTDGYNFDAKRDVCPLSGRVNRFGGLRYRTKEVAISVLSSGWIEGRATRVEVALLDGNPAGSSLLASTLAKRPVLVSCMGYRARLPHILDSQNCPVALKFDAGGLAVDSWGRVYDIDGRVVAGLHSFGLGSGLRAHPAVGGEPGYFGRLDGVWLYHFDVGERVVTGFLKGFD